MRVHTNLKFREIFEVLRRSGAPVDAEVLTEHKSRTHDRAFEVRLSGHGGMTNSGNHGAGSFQGATWDEWGAFFGALYDMDPEARCGGTAERPIYRDRLHFHFLTGDRFQKWFPHDQHMGTYLPADTHPRHHWAYESEGFYCTKCTAHRPSWQQVDAYAPRAYDPESPGMHGLTDQSGDVIESIDPAASEVFMGSGEIVAADTEEIYRAQGWTGEPVTGGYALRGYDLSETA